MTRDLNRRQLLQAGAVVGFSGLVPLRAAPGAWAVAAQTPLPGRSLRQFVDALPVLGTPGLAVVTATDVTLSMQELQTYMLPTGTFGPGVRSATWAYGYVVGSAPVTAARETYLGPVVIAQRHTPTTVRWVNDLPTVAASNVPVWAAGSDLTLHWANPLDEPVVANDTRHYTGPIPAVPHLHGGEVPPVLDGGPDSWFTRDGIHGHAYHAGPGGGGNTSVYRYPNTQEAAPAWFHDHVLGATRLNVYAGLAGAYLITDPTLTLPPGLEATGLRGPTGATENLVPLVIQDRSFDTTGQLLIPNTGLNPEHPYWVPEFVGDTILVNGRVWPHLSVEPRRYRFLLINGSNARAYELYLDNPVTKVKGPPMYQIGTDGGYLDRPVRIDPNAPKGPVLQRLTLLPGERADVVIDFGGLQGQNLVLRNLARHPYPKGAAPDGATLGRVMQFRVSTAATTELPYDPARGEALRSTPMVRLADPATAALAAGVNADRTRQLTLNEVMGMGGPLEVLINNTTWHGMRRDGTTPTGFVERGVHEFFSEVVDEGETEVWEIVNLTADAHPIHTHLAQVQVVNRQGFNVSTYTAAYDAAFPGGAYVPGYGPPLAYTGGNPRALGGNPDLSRHLQGGRRPPAPNEAGWKDTVTAFPGEVTRFVVRYAPTDLAVDSADLAYPFDPDAGETRHGYVWHCHIIDHEDNEMMRPLAVNAKAVVRSVTDF